MGAFLFDQVFDEWISLVQQEDNADYKIQTAASSSAFAYDNLRWRPSSDKTFEYCRTVFRDDICDWCYQLIDHCDIDRGVVGIALAYFDRYLTLHTSMNEALVQLVAMTSLYLAVKVHSTKKISVSCMASLSKDNFRVDQITKMEICIIKALRWRLNPPTPFIYLTVAGPLIDDFVDEEDTSTNVKELSRYLVELSVCDGDFIDKKPSSIAYAAILVALDVLSFTHKSSLLQQLDISPELTKRCMNRLRKIYDIASLQLEGQDTASSSGRCGSSPTTVSC